MSTGCGRSSRGLAESEETQTTPVASSRGGAVLEAELQLGKLKKNIRTAFVTDAVFPTGATPLTPTTPCCQQPGRACQPGAADWNHSIWKALEFQLDEPSHFQYSYQGKADQFLITAVGDPGCTGKPVKLLLAGASPDCMPTFTITRSQ